MASTLATAILLSNTASDESISKENRCLQTARWIGAISGSTMGFLHIYWSATGVSGIHGPFWKNLATGIPSALVGAYVGAKATEWTTRQIMKGNPKPAKAILKGAAYGTIERGRRHAVVYCGTGSLQESPPGVDFYELEESA